MTITIGNRSDAIVQDAMVDTFLDLDMPMMNTGSHVDLHLISEGFGPVLAKFDLSSVPAGTITDAFLQLWVISDDLEATATVVLYRVNEAWLEGTVDFELGVSNAGERLPGTAWTDPAAGPPTSRDATGFAVGAGPTPVGDAMTLTLPPAIVETWRDPNNTGFALYAEDPDSAYSEVGSSEAPDETKRPLLTVRVAP